MSTITIRLASETAHQIRHAIEIAASGRPLSDELKRTLAGFCQTIMMTDPDRPDAPLTKRQHDVLAFIESYIEDHGYSPTYQEIAQHFGYLSVGTVHEHIHNLVRKRYLAHGHNAERYLKVLIGSKAVTPLGSLGSLGSHAGESCG